MVPFLKNQVQNTHVMKTVSKISTVAEELGAWTIVGIMLFAAIKLIVGFF